MKTIRSSHFACAAILALLALPAAALAQSAQSSGPTTPPAAASSPIASQPISGKSMQERVENHIKQLHAQLRITPAEQPQWDQFAQVMRDNARDMDQAIIQRAQQYPTMNAVQNMQSWEQIAEAHARQLQKLVPAFDNLYNAICTKLFSNASRKAASSTTPAWDSKFHVSPPPTVRRQRLCRHAAGNVGAVLSKDATIRPASAVQAASGSRQANMTNDIRNGGRCQWADPECLSIFFRPLDK